MRTRLSSPLGGTLAGIALLVGCGGGGSKTATAPSITTQPSAVTVALGGSATLSVTATGSGTLSYQWYRSGTAISGATGSSYTIASATTSDAAIYYVIVSDANGSTVSTSVRVTVTSTSGPTISSQPSSLTVAVGGSAAFSVGATGSGTLTYQWYKAGTAITGATGSSYTIASASSSDAGSYWVTVQDDNATTTSDTATLTVTGSASNYLQTGGTATLDGKAYASSTSDQNAVKVIASGTLTLTNSTLTKSGDTASEDNSNFKGINAGVLASVAASESDPANATTGSAITLSGCSISTASSGSNAVFAYGKGSSVTLDKVTITTTKDSSRGVDATFGGRVTLTDTTITTSGNHCAALATDRGNGTILATNCTGTTAGEGSPGIYCTGTFTITGGTYLATGSEAACIEGLNSITTTDASITGTVKRGVMIYQSNSGDAATGAGTLTMTGGSLTSKSSTGPLFFVCNTSALITLKGVALSQASGLLLKAAAPSSSDSDTNTDWGTLGGTVTFVTDGQALSGDIVADASSPVSLTLQNASTLSGAINSANTAKSVALTLGTGCTWTLTGNSHVSSLSNSGTIHKGSYTLYVNGVAQ